MVEGEGGREVGRGVKKGGKVSWRLEQVGIIIINNIIIIVRCRGRYVGSGSTRSSSSGDALFHKMQARDQSLSPQIRQKVKILIFSQFCDIF